MNGWFAPESSPTPDRDAADRVPQPIGARCLHCDETIAAEDRGFAPGPFHRECYLRMLTGGLNHLHGDCTCCGGDQPPDPPELSRRDAARVAVEEWELRQSR